MSAKPTWAKFTGGSPRILPSTLIPIRNITDASPSSPIARNSLPRASRPIRNASPSSTGSRSTSTIPIANSSLECPPTPPSICAKLIERFRAMESSSSAIEVRGLSRSFGEVVAVRDLSFSVRPGEIFSLVGPDGAGKTTILRMLAGILVPDKGEITVAGCNVIADPDGVKSRISYMPQRFGLYEDLTSEENMRFYADMYGVSRRDYADQSA